MKRTLKKGFAAMLSMIMIAELVLVSATPWAAYAEDSLSTIKTVNLNNNGTIQGINNPGQPDSADDSWGDGTGSYVYFGEFYQTDRNSAEPVLWRVLSKESDRMLLLSDKVLDQQEFRVDWTTSDANKWAASDLRKWLNSTDNWSNGGTGDGGGTAGGFLANAFSTAEQNAILATTKANGGSANRIWNTGHGWYLDEQAIDGDKVFVLSAKEADTAAYGFKSVNYLLQANSTIALAPTAYAKSQGVYADGGNGAWWLRSALSDDISNVGNVSYDNGFGYGPTEYYLVGVAPALNLNLAAVIFTYASGVEKPDTLTLTDDAGDMNVWNLTITGGSGFAAELASGEFTTVAPGASLKVNVTDIGNSDVMYTQISAMLVDSNGTVAAYGKVSDNVEAGVVDIEIPSNLSSGEYTLKVFAEDVNSSATKSAVGYASNMADIQMTVAKNVTMPTANYATGTYEQNLGVVLTCETIGATIYYTTDGSVPTTASTEYTGEIAVEGIAGSTVVKTIKAIAVKAGIEDSEVLELEYTINLPIAGEPTTEAITVEAEDYTASEGVSVKTVGDVQLVYTIHANDWMEYTIDVAKAGYYRFNVTAGKAHNTPTVIALRNADGYVVAEATITTTGGWDICEEFTGSLVYLKAGTQTVSLYAVGGNYNVDSFSLVPETVEIDDGTICVEAEAYDSAYGIEVIKRDNDTAVVYKVHDGDYMVYTVDVEEAGSYSFNVCAAKAYGLPTAFELTDGTNVLASAKVSTTGSWFDYQMFGGSTVDLEPGTYTFYVNAKGGNNNLDFITLINETTY